MKVRVPAVSRRIGGRKAALESGILASRNKFWRPADLPGSRSAVQHLLADLVRRGELRHIRKSLYWRGVLTPLGMSPPSPDALVRELVGSSGVGPAGLSAANALRLSTQVPRRAHVAVPERAPSGSGPVVFVSREARKGRAKEKLNAQEVAVLEVLDGWDRVIEMPLPEAWNRLVELMRNESVRPEKLARASATEPGPVRAKLQRLMADADFTRLADSMPAPDPRNVRALQSALNGAQ